MGFKPQLHAMIYTTIGVAKFQSTDCFETLAFLFLNRCFGLCSISGSGELKSPRSSEWKASRVHYIVRLIFSNRKMRLVNVVRHRPMSPGDGRE